MGGGQVKCGGANVTAGDPPLMASLVVMVSLLDNLNNAHTGLENETNTYFITINNFQAFLKKSSPFALFNRQHSKNHEKEMAACDTIF
jgi:hypothetical protein